MPRFVLGKVRKFQDPSSNRLGDIQEKPEGWIKTTPPLPLIGLMFTRQVLTSTSKRLVVARFAKSDILKCIRLCLSPFLRDLTACLLPSPCHCKLHAAVVSRVAGRLPQRHGSASPAKPCPRLYQTPAKSRRAMCLHTSRPDFRRLCPAW